MPAYRPIAVVLRARLRETPCPITHDRLGRPIVGPCQIWTAAPDSKGYGVVGNKDFGSTRLERVHRVAYALATGVPPTEIRNVPPLDHLCRVTLCAAVPHLEPCSQAENIRRGDWHNGNAEKTECLRGHLFDEANTYRKPGGGRDCRACIRLRARGNYDPVARAIRHQAKRAARQSAG